MGGPLAGVRVVELATMLSGPYAAQMLGDLGAEVVKVEPPEGDAMRGIGPFRSPGMGAIFLNANRNKKSVTLDLKLEKDAAAFRRLLAEADVFVCNVRPKAMRRLNLDFESLRRINQNLVYVSISGYGPGGPYEERPAYDDLIQAAVGIPSMLAAGGRFDPHYAPIAIADRVAALNAVVAACAALYHRATDGGGQYIEIPMFETVSAFVLSDHLAGQTYDPPLGPTGFTRYVSVRKPFATADGHISIMIHTDKQWRSFCVLADRQDLLDDGRFANVTVRTRHLRDFYGAVEEMLATQTTEWWIAGLEQADIPAMPLHSTDDLLEDQHLKATNFFTVADHPTEGRVRVLPTCGIWSKTQPDVRRLAPYLGEHNDELDRFKA